MKSKLALICVTVIASATWWAGCGGSSDSGSSTKDAGTGGETGGNTEGGSDAASDAPVDASLDTSITGNFVDLAYGTCPGPAKCASSVVGTWRISGGCVSDTVFDELKTQAMCPTLTTSAVKFQARGVVSANALKIASSSELKFAAKVFVPSSCQRGFTCPDIGTALVAVPGGLKTATCVDAAPAGTGCDCAVTGESKTAQAADTYTTSAGVLTTGAGHTYDYCVTGTELKYRETTNNTQVPATLTLTKQ